MADKDPKTKKKLTTHRVADKTAAATQKGEKHKIIVAASQERDLTLDENGIPVDPSAVSRNKRGKGQKKPNHYKAVQQSAKASDVDAKASGDTVTLLPRRKKPKHFTLPKGASLVLQDVLSMMYFGEPILESYRKKLTEADRDIIRKARNAGQVKETGVVISREDLKKIRAFQGSDKKLG